MTTPAAPRKKSSAAKEPSKIPAGAKLPQDHRPAKDDVDGVPAVTVEWDGHKYTIDGEAFTDLEVLDLGIQIEEVVAGRDVEHDRAAQVQLTVLQHKYGKRLLGDAQFRQWMDNHRGKNGRVDSVRFQEFVAHIVTKTNQGNS